MKKIKLKRLLLSMFVLMLFFLLIFYDSKNGRSPFEVIEDELTLALSRMRNKHQSRNTVRLFN